MSIKSHLAPAAFGISAIGLALIASSAYFGSRLERVGVAELEEVRGLSTWRTIFSIQDCSQYNTGIANDPTQPPIPGQPPGNITSVDNCPAPKNGWCLECDGNSSQFTGAQNVFGPGINGMMDTHTLSCGNLYFGRCQPNGVGGFTCNNNGNAAANCADATEYLVQANPGKP